LPSCGRPARASAQTFNLFLSGLIALVWSSSPLVNRPPQQDRLALAKPTFSPNHRSSCLRREAFSASPDDSAAAPSAGGGAGAAPEVRGCSPPGSLPSPPSLGDAAPPPSEQPAGLHSAVASPSMLGDAPPPAQGRHDAAARQRVSVLRQAPDPPLRRPESSASFDPPPYVSVLHEALGYHRVRARYEGEADTSPGGPDTAGRDDAAAAVLGWLGYCAPTPSAPKGRRAE
jgi:hypothetical protein